MGSKGRKTCRKERSRKLRYQKLRKKRETQTQSELIAEEISVSLVQNSGQLSSTDVQNLSENISDEPITMNAPDSLREIPSTIASVVELRESVIPNSGDSITMDHLNSRAFVNDMESTAIAFPISPISDIFDYQIGIDERSLPNLSIEPYTPPQRKFIVPENSKTFAELDGNRIVDIKHFVVSVRSLDVHRCETSKNGAFVFHQEKRNRLVSELTFKCNKCDEIKLITTAKICDPIGGRPKIHHHRNRDIQSATNGEKKLSLNALSVWGFVSIGSGYANMDEVLSVMGIPNMSKPSYLKKEAELGQLWESALAQEMIEAGKVEHQLAVENGDVANGIPFVTVIIDGGWSQRSHGHRYSAKCGVACIIGAKTKKLLFIGVRNKYCCICSMYKDSRTVPPHVCFKNYEGSSPGMESDILIEGFHKSVEMHGVEYRTIIGDGDSSVHKKLKDCVSYGANIKKSECANHVVRNYRSKLYNLAKANKDLSQVRIVKMGKGVRAAIANVAKELKKEIFDTKTDEKEIIDIAATYKKYADQLRMDVKNVHSHVFGRHTQCRAYYCKNVGKDNSGHLSKALDMKLLEASQRVQDLASSLLDNETNNLAENYMSLVAKAVGGKQICFNRRGSYFTRCTAAALQFHLGRKWHVKTLRAIINDSPFQTIKNHAARNQNQKKLKKRSLLKDMNRVEYSRKQNTNDPKNYGPNSEKPDMDPEDMERRTIEILAELAATPEEQNLIERSTVEQAACEEWKMQRLKRLTASNFGKVAKRKPETGYGTLVQQILHPKTFSSYALEWGKSKERDAIEAYENKKQVSVNPSGLFVDLKIGYLAASPDGLTEKNGIIEVKCPYSARHIHPRDAPSKLPTFCSKLVNGQLRLKKTHDYYIQIQGQLHIARKEYCDFIIWTPRGMEVERIFKDTKFWESKLEKLKEFYVKCMLPEIIDSRFSRSMPIREPESFYVGVKEKQKRKVEPGKSKKITKSRKIAMTTRIATASSERKNVAHSRKLKEAKKTAPRKPKTAPISRKIGMTTRKATSSSETKKVAHSRKLKDTKKTAPRKTKTVAKPRKLEITKSKSNGQKVQKSEINQKGNKRKSNEPQNIKRRKCVKIK